MAEELVEGESETVRSFEFFVWSSSIIFLPVYLITEII